MSWKGLRHKGAEVLTSREWNTVVDALDELHGTLTDGTKDVNVNKVSAKAGEFSESLTLQGKAVLKDGDPIHVASFLDEAKDQITQAIDASRITEISAKQDTAIDRLTSIRDTLTRISVDEAGNLSAKLVGLSPTAVANVTQAIDSSKVSDILGKQDSIIDKLASLISAVEDLKYVRGTPSKDLDSYTLDPGATVEIVKGDLDGWAGLTVTVRATYSAEASNGVRVRWMFSPDGTNFDTPEDAEAEGNYMDLTFSPGATRQRTVMIAIVAPHVKIHVVNLDPSYSVTVSAWTIPVR